MNFDNLKLPVQGKSQVFKPLHSSREMKAQSLKNTLIGSKGKPDCLVNFGAALKTMFVHTLIRGF